MGMTSNLSLRLSDSGYRNSLKCFAETHGQTFADWSENIESKYDICLSPVCTPTEWIKIHIIIYKL
jgi:hypothetical protein